MARDTRPDLSEVFLTILTTEYLGVDGATAGTHTRAQGPYSTRGAATTRAKRESVDRSSASYRPRRRTTAKVYRAAVTWEEV